MKYDIEFIDVKRGTASATIAAYGVTFNAAATQLISNSEWGRIGIDKSNRLIVLQTLNSPTEPDAFQLRVRGGVTPYLRISSKDLVRLVVAATGMAIDPSPRCLVTKDAETGYIIVDLKQVLDVGRKRAEKRGKAIA